MNKDKGRQAGVNGNYQTQRDHINNAGYKGAHDGGYGDDAFDFGYDSASDLVYEPQHAVNGMGVSAIGTTNSEVLSIELIVGLVVLLFALCVVGVVCFVSGMFVGGTVFKVRGKEENKKEMAYHVVSVEQ